jgi:hypothetical protein
VPVKKVSQQANIPPIIFVSSEHAAAPEKLNPAITRMARRLNKALSRAEQEAKKYTKSSKIFITNSLDKLSPQNLQIIAKQFKKLFQEDPNLEDFFKNIIVKAFSFGQSKDKQRTIAKLILDLAEENLVSFLAGAIYAAHGSRGSKILEDCLSEIKTTGMEKFQKIFMALINSCQFNFNDQLFHQHLLSLGSFAEKALRKLGLKQNTADHLNAFYKDCLRKLYKISYESGLDKLDLDSDSNILLFEKPIFDKSLMTKDTIVSSILTLKQLWASHIMNHPRLKSSFHSSLVLLDPFTRNPFEIDITDDYTTPLNNFFVGTNVFFEPIVSLANSHKSHKKLFAQKLENILDKLFFSFDNLSHQCYKKLEIYLNTYKSLFPDQAQKYLLDSLERSS